MKRYINRGVSPAHWRSSRLETSGAHNNEREERIERRENIMERIERRERRENRIEKE
jgi:hypothetical protein